MAMQWSIRTHDTEIIQAIERSTNVSPVVAQILALRGLTNNDQITSFLDLKMTGFPPPQRRSGGTQAVQAYFISRPHTKKNFTFCGFHAQW